VVSNRPLPAWEQLKYNRPHAAHTPFGLTVERSALPVHPWPHTARGNQLEIAICQNLQTALSQLNIF
jgi:hypothetical protein